MTYSLPSCRRDRLRGPAALSMLPVAAALALGHAALAMQAAGSAAQPGTPGQTAAPAKSAREILDERYVMGPTAADLFGYRIAWQTEPLATAGATAQCVSVGNDSVWFADSAGSVVRVRRDNGETVWRASSYKGIEKVIAIEHLPRGSDDRVYVMTDINVVALNALTGELEKRSNFSQLPGARPAVFGPYVIFGTRTGLVAWHQYGTGFGWRATTIGGSMLKQPTVAGDLVLAGATSGKVLALEAGTTRVVWDRHLSAGVETKIAADDKAAFVAGRDQSLWAFDLSRGRVLWHYFTQAQLLNDPVRLADGLYLQIPGEGLVSFNPHPVDRPEGEVRWKANVPGEVIGRLGPNLLVWCSASSTLSNVAAVDGRVVNQGKLAQVKLIESVPLINGDLFVCGEDGRIERLEPLARPEVPSSTIADDADASAEGAQPAPEAAPAAPAPDSSAPATAPSEGGARIPAPRFNERLR